jgi:hypothetical protein
MPFIDFSENKTIHLKNEHDLQTQVVEYLRSTDLTFAANLNGFLDTPEKRIRGWQEGMSAGHPDLLIYTPNNTYNGMAIEFKNVNGQGILAKKQADWLQKLEGDCKYFCICSNDYTVILECIIKYLLNVL